MVEHIGRRVCIDRSRQYMAGMSQGGMFTSYMLTQASDLFAGFAPVSGTNPRDFFEDGSRLSDLSIVWVHGRKDTTVPYNGAMAGAYGSCGFAARPQTARCDTPAVQWVLFSWWWCAVRWRWRVQYTSRFIACSVVLARGN